MDIKQDSPVPPVLVKVITVPGWTQRMVLCKFPLRMDHSAQSIIQNILRSYEN